MGLAVRHSVSDGLATEGQGRESAAVIITIVSTEQWLVQQRWLGPDPRVSDFLGQREGP